MWRLIVLIFGLALLSSCASLTQAPSAHIVPFQIRQQQLSQLDHWHLIGKASFQQNNTINTANLDWIENRPGSAHETYTLRLSGPLGLGSVMVRKDRAGVTLITAHGKQYHGASANALLSQIAHIYLPLSELTFWIRSIPAPTHDARYQLARYWDKAGHMTKLQQNNWEIQYLSYQSVNGYDLPSRININSLATKPMVKVKIHVASWQLD